MNNLSTAAAYSIMGVINGAILSKSGVISVVYAMNNPEPYTLDQDGLQQRHNDFMRALKLPPGSYFHKQDVFLRKTYDGSHIKGDSFIQQAERRHFSGRKYLEHHSIVAFSLAGLGSLEKAYTLNPLQYSEKLIEEDKKKLSEFLDAVQTAVTIINNIPGTRINPLSEEDTKYYLYHYVNGFSGDDGLRDLHFGANLEIGEAKAVMFSISDENYLPDSLPLYVDDDTLPRSNAVLSMAMLEKLGLHIHSNHVYNQVIYFEGSQDLKNQLDARVLNFGKHRNFSKQIEITHKHLEEFQNEVVEEQAVLCRAHFSIMAWDEDAAELTKAKEAIKEVLRNRDIRFYQPSHEGIRNLFIGTVIGRENKLDKDFFFMTELAVALTLFINYSVFQDDQEGVLFSDRIFQKPLRKDIWDEKKRRMPARNSMFIASTGGGKSSASLNICQQYIEQGVKTIVVEFGKSFLPLARLYKDRSAHIDYDGSTPLGINPFYIARKEEFTIEKLKTLAVIVLKFWRVKEIREDAHQVVSLTKILQDYYEHVKEGHSFPNFYEYIKIHHKEILERQNIAEAYFDVESFLHICSEFMAGGIYENVCIQQGSNEDKIRSKDFVVFELTRIKKDPFLVSLIMTIIFDTVENKILSDRATKGMLWVDEYGEAQAMQDIFSGDDIHSAVAFFYQKLRKENGAICTIIQSPAQLPPNNYTKGIIANTQVLYVLPTTETVYDQVIEAFHIKNIAHINLMKSIKNDFSGKRPYSEIFIRFQDLYATGVRLEFSREKFYAFQTDGPDWQFLSDDYAITESMEISINNLIKSKNHEKVSF